MSSVLCIEEEGSHIKRRMGPNKKCKKEYFPAGSSEVSLLVRKEKIEGKKIKDQILGYLGLLDEN